MQTLARLIGRPARLPSESLENQGIIIIHQNHDDDNDHNHHDHNDVKNYFLGFKGHYITLQPFGDDGGGGGG